MNHLTGHFTTSDNLELYYQVWEPEEKANALMILIHGIGEHSGRYEHMADVLTKSGIVTGAMDMRGHGKSPGKRGDTPSYDALLKDVDTFAHRLLDAYHDLPAFIYGHSLGGNIVLNYVLKYPVDRLKGVIASAPALGLATDPPRIKVLLGKLMLGLFPSFQLASELDTSALSRDASVVDAYIKDPLVHDKVSPRLFFGFMDGGRWVLEHANELSLPCLVIQGTDDRLVSVEATKAFAESAGATLSLWKGGYHEMHNEPEKEKVFNTLIQWINSQLD